MYLYMYRREHHLKPQTVRAIVEIELCLFDVLVYAQISYVRAVAPPRQATRSRALTPRREKPARGKVEQCTNNMSGRMRMRKPFHYQSNWFGTHAPAHTPRHTNLMTVISFDAG